MRARTIVVWVIFLVLGGGVIVHEGTDLFRPPPPEKTGSWPMFAFSEEDLGAVELIYEGETASAMRGPDGRWFLHDGSHSHAEGAETALPGERHSADPELSAAIARQLDVTARMIADRRLMPEQNLAAYGLANPTAIFIFYGRDGNDIDYSRPLSILHVGELLPSELTYYTRRDGDEELSLVPRYQVVLLLTMAFGPDKAPARSPDFGTERPRGAGPRPQF